QVIELVLVTGTGEVLTLSDKKHPDLFQASLVSLGCLGIIVKVKLKIIRAPVYQFKSYKLNYLQLEAQLDELIKTNRHFECFVFPYSDLVQVKTMNIANNRPQNTKLYELKNLILENY